MGSRVKGNINSLPFVSLVCILSTANWIQMDFTVRANFDRKYNRGGGGRDAHVRQGRRDDPPPPHSD